MWSCTSNMQRCLQSTDRNTVVTQGKCTVPRASLSQALLPAPIRCIRGQQPCFRLVKSKTSMRRTATVTYAAASTSGGVLISKTEVPAFIPRDDMADQLVRWAVIESNDNAISKYGMPFKVEEVFRQDDGRLWGANVKFLRNGEPVTTLYIGFDEDVVLKHEWLGMNDLGFPVPEGNSTEINGKNLEIRKVCDSKVDDQLRGAIKEVCKALVTIINKYYAFGSVFVDEAT